MTISNKRRNLICASLVSLACGLGGIVQAVAQNAADPAANSQSVSNAARTQSANQADEDLRNRVQNALHVDPYFYDAHVRVSVEKGTVVLHGFVFSDWDLRDALRIARKAAGITPVVDNLSIKVGGRR